METISNKYPSTFCQSGTNVVQIELEAVQELLPRIDDKFHRGWYSLQARFIPEEPRERFPPGKIRPRGS